MYDVGKEIDFYKIQRKKERENIIALLILNVAAFVFVIFALTL